MKKRLITLAAMLMAGALVAGCGAKTAEETPETGISQETPGDEGAVDKVKVATSINPIDEIVKIVGGNRIETWKVVPEGSEAHDFEPTIKDMGRLTEVDLLFINGLEMEPWAGKAVENSGNKTLQIVDLSEGVNLIHLDEADPGHDDEGDEDHGDFDPHIWLSVDSLVTMAEHAKNELTLLVPEAESYFEENYNAFKEEALALKNDYVEKFKPYEGKAFVTGHAAFGYMTRELGLVQKSVEGPFQEGEPTPKKLEDLIEFVKSEGIKTIFLEEAASPKVSETLARETGSETVAINPLESSGELLPTLKETYEKVLQSFNR